MTSYELSKLPNVNKQGSIHLFTFWSDFGGMGKKRRISQDNIEWIVEKTAATTCAKHKNSTYDFNVKIHY